MLNIPWARPFKVKEADIDLLTNMMVEQESPMILPQLALILVEQKLQAERDIVDAKYKDAEMYKPSKHYEVGSRIIFSEMGFATANVTNVRPGNNIDYGDYEVISVKFDDASHNLADKPREFAAALQTDHKLSAEDADLPVGALGNISAQDIMSAYENDILDALYNALEENEDLARVAGYWFPRELVIDVDEGMIHLSEAVLDMHGGGPMQTTQIIEEIGGLGTAPLALQVFSLNLALNKDPRFDEVGPSGEILWYLRRLAPPELSRIPEVLRYTPITYDRSLLTADDQQLESDLGDEQSELPSPGQINQARYTLIYPHRRSGTMPLNARTRQIFPKARTPRIYVSLIDESDGETFTGWVAHEHKFVSGLLPYYSKHRLPIGVYITVRRGEEPGEVILSHNAYRPRTEWINVFIPSNEQILFESKKRSIGADYDDLQILGVDDLKMLDTMVKVHQSKTLVAILRSTIQELSKLSPQSTVHVSTLYSAVNVIRRCPPGPIMAILRANPDFEAVGEFYWKLST